MKKTIFILLAVVLNAYFSINCFAEELPSQNRPTSDCETNKIKVCILPIYDHADTRRTGDFKREVLSTLTDLINTEYIEYEVSQSHYYSNIMGGKSDNHKAIEKQIWEKKRLNLKEATAYVRDANADIAITYLINSTSFSDRFSCFLFDPLKNQLFEKTATEELGRNRIFHGYVRIKAFSRQLLDDYLADRSDLKKVQDDAICNVNESNLVILPFHDPNSHSGEYSKREIINDLKLLTDEKENPFHLSGFLTNEPFPGVVNLPYKRPESGFWVDNQPNVESVKATMYGKNADLALGYHIDIGPREKKYCCYLLDTKKNILLKECGIDDKILTSFASYGAIKNSSMKLFDRYKSMTEPPKPKVSLKLTPAANAKKKIFIFPVYQKVTRGASYKPADERRITTDLFDIFSEDLDMILYSFYELYGNKNKYVKNNKEDFGAETKDFWIKRSFWSTPAPNYNLMKKILSETNVDYGFTLRIESGFDGCKYTAFIIDLKNNSVNQLTGTSTDQTHSFSIYSGIKDLTEEMIDQYLLANERKIIQTQ